MMRFETLREWLAWQESLHPLTIDLGLERVERVYRALNPSRLKPPTITVGGTNGKGSCVAYLEAIYTTQGYKVGAYTSPHILKYNERIKINGKAVSDELICEAFGKIEAVRDNTSLSYFEFGTLAALYLFNRAHVDIQLLEVGLGGRLDAVNIVDPDAAIIAAIGIDHVEWLGSTREAIGREKAGVFRPGIPAIIGDPQPPSSLADTAKAKSADLYSIGRDFGYRKRNGTWDWHDGNQLIKELPEPALKGEHQYRNASSVVMAVRQLEKRLPVSENSIRQGLSRAHLAGRFQLIEDKVPVLLDVGHNIQAVQTLIEYLQKHFPNTRVHAVFAMMKDKDIAGVLKIMAPIVYDWFFAPLTNPRAISEAGMQAIFAAGPASRAFFGFKGFAEAFAAAKKQAQPGDLVLVFGSFFLVSDCLSEFAKGKLTK